MRILHATPTFAPAYAIGGPVRSLEGLTECLAAQGHNVRVITTDANGRERLPVKPGWCRRNGVSVCYLPRWAAPDITPTVASYVACESLRADVVHVTGVFSAPSALALAATAPRVPIVLSPRGSLSGVALQMGRSNRKRRWLRTLAPLFARVSAFHATSQEEATDIRSTFGDHCDVVVIPNGVDARLLTAPAAVRTGPPIIGALGRIHPVKRYELLLASAHELMKRDLRFRVAIAGPVEDVQYQRALESEVARRGLDGVVSFRGPLFGDDKLAFLSACSVVALTSSTENFGNVVIEALGRGTPVVATRQTPWSELEAAGCGRWIEADPFAIADAIEPFISDPSRSEEHGGRGRALVTSKYTWSAVAGQMLGTYVSVARGRTQPSER